MFDVLPQVPCREHGVETTEVPSPEARASLDRLRVNDVSFSPRREPSGSPSFRGPCSGTGLRVLWRLSVTYFAYLDEFGHIGPYVNREHPRYNDSPVFGLAGFREAVSAEDIPSPQADLFE